MHMESHIARIRGRTRWVGARDSRGADCNCVATLVALRMTSHSSRRPGVLSTDDSAGLPYGRRLDDAVSDARAGLPRTAIRLCMAAAAGVRHGQKWRQQERMGKQVLLYQAVGAHSAAAVMKSARYDCIIPTLPRQQGATLWRQHTCSGAPHLGAEHRGQDSCNCWAVLR